MQFSKATREKNIKQIKNEKVDLLIIGGGITGAGVALQAQASGIKTVLVEMQDFAEGTSSRSTKLVHGGLRYLKTFDVEVVADTVGERANVQKIAPHIPKPDPMILPVYDEPGSTFNMFTLKVAMDLYDHLAHVGGTKYANYMLTKEEVLKKVPQINAEKLLGAGVYLDFKNNDARLVIENIKQAVSDGAIALNKTKVIDIIHDENGKVNGATVEDLLTGEVFNIEANVVINTAGPWSDMVRKLDKSDSKPPQMRPTKGVHLVVDSSKIKVPQPIYFDSGKNDGRMVFVIPRENKTYFGTTDTDFKGDFKHPQVEQVDVDYLLSVVNLHFPDANIKLDDIESSWAGLRPLISSNGGSDYNGGSKGTLSQESFESIIGAVKNYLSDPSKKEEVENEIINAETTVDNSINPSQVSRGSSLEISDDNLITLAGGKLTDYRLMAQGAVEMIIKVLSEKFQKEFTLIDSTQYPVSGGKFDFNKVEEELSRLAQVATAAGLSQKDADYLVNLYGSNIGEVIKYNDQVEGLSMRDSMSLNYALNEEAVLTPSDFLMRRTNYILFMRDQLDEVIEPILKKMSEYFDWNENELEKNKNELKEVISESDLKHLK